MSQIRRVKLSEHSYVTPNEFRYTLIKFGVNLSQPVVDAVFNVFDSDRSGTMDFDEFATWIMNADSRPYKPPPAKGAAAPAKWAATPPARPGTPGGEYAHAHRVRTTLLR